MWKNGEPALKMTYIKNRVFFPPVGSDERRGFCNRK